MTTLANSATIALKTKRQIIDEVLSDMSPPYERKKVIQIANDRLVEQQRGLEPWRCRELFTYGDVSRAIVHKRRGFAPCHTEAGHRSYPTKAAGTWIPGVHGGYPNTKKVITKAPPATHVAPTTTRTPGSYTLDEFIAAGRLFGLCGDSERADALMTELLAKLNNPKESI